MTTEYDLPQLCENLRRLRAAHGLSKQKMASILGVGVPMVTALENGIVSRRLRCSALIRASDYFGITIEDLVRSAL